MLNKVRKPIRSMLRRNREKLLSARLPGGRSLYFELLSGGFHNEQRAVAAGMAAYDRREGTDAHQYLLRRNVHMIEKGLTMQPRRTTFAEDYIKATVDALARYMPAHGDEIETRWFVDVLDDYFEATSESTSSIISAARTKFLSTRRHEPRLAERASVSPTPLTEGVVDVDDLLLLARNRRSVRWFDGRPVDRGAVIRAVEIGLEAPTACNRQPYRFLIIDDPSKVQEVGVIPMGTKGYIHQVPGLIVVVGDMSAFFSDRDRHLIYIDGSLATMGLILGLEAQGIGSCCINWPDIREREVRMAKAIGLSEHERVVMLIAYGYPDPKGLTPFSSKRAATETYEFIPAENNEVV
jgi:nitroreductase